MSRHSTPASARARADGDRAHVDARQISETAERVQPDSYDRDVHSSPPCTRSRAGLTQATGRNAKVTTSLPSSSVRNGTSTSSISMPIFSPSVA